MRILHTSDWHLGQYLMTKDRKQEHQRFLNWLIEYLRNQPYDVLIVAGDIFDSSTPPNYALKMYFDFLRGVSETACNSVIIIGGNHDSVSTLHAPRDLLSFFKVHVVGGIGDDIDDEIIIVNDAGGKPVGIVCAVPFLRDRDIRQSIAGESYEDRNKAIVEGIADHYRNVKNKALRVESELKNNGKRVPIVATGHLFAAGGAVSDGIREIHVGSLGHVNASLFPSEFSYIALGHLHKTQKVSGLDHIRYSGSPIPLSFSEAGSKKQMISIEFESSVEKPIITDVPIPEFHKIRCVRGDLITIENRLKEMGEANADETIWVEIQVDTDDWIPDVQSRIQEMVEETPIEILAVKNARHIGTKRLEQKEQQITLHELSPSEVFQKRLEVEETLSEEDKVKMTRAFEEIVNRVNTREEEEVK
ncbi:exonuclease SbcCD subunit D C-terminal domain-containing protein [bacterium]|nr:exonuclease SbcCD subunit D C-terminal domain-containing protein [bacterium]